MGYFRIELGCNLLLIETNIAWATPGSYSEWYVAKSPTIEKYVDNNNINNNNDHHHHRSLRRYDYVDPSVYYSTLKSS